MNPSGGASGGQSASDQPSPPQGSGEPQQREKTPDAPGDKPDPQGQQPPKPDQPGEGQPKDPKDSHADARNSPGGPPPELATGRFDPAALNERWGELPLQVRDLFRTEGGASMPPQYRDWIDAYYRRLNQPVR